jgi:hypothetical protein
MKRSLRTYILFIIEIVWLLLLIQGKFLWPLFLIVSFFLIVIVVIKEDSDQNIMIGLILSLVASLVSVVSIWSWFLALLARHLWLIVVYGMIRRYEKNAVHVGPMSLTVRASSWMTLSLVVTILSFLTLHFSLEDIGCDDITTIVQQYSPTIDQRIGENNSVLPSVILSDQAPQRQNKINMYLTQIEQTREQKNTLDDQVCMLFIDSIHKFGKKAGVQLGSLWLLSAVIYTIAYIPMLFISYLFAGILYLLVTLGLIKRKEMTSRRKYLT